MDVVFDPCGGMIAIYCKTGFENDPGHMQDVWCV